MFFYYYYCFSIFFLLNFYCIYFALSLLCLFALLIFVLWLLIFLFFISLFVYVCVCVCVCVCVLLSLSFFFLPPLFLCAVFISLRVGLRLILHWSKTKISYFGVVYKPLSMDMELAVIKELFIILYIYCIYFLTNLF